MSLTDRLVNGGKREPPASKTKNALGVANIVLTAALTVVVIVLFSVYVPRIDSQIQAANRLQAQVLHLQELVDVGQSSSNMTLLDSGTFNWLTCIETNFYPTPEFTYPANYSIYSVQTGSLNTYLMRLYPPATPLQFPLSWNVPTPLTRVGFGMINFVPNDPTIFPASVYTNLGDGLLMSISYPNREKLGLACLQDQTCILSGSWQPPRTPLYPFTLYGDYDGLQTSIGNFAITAVITNYPTTGSVTNILGQPMTITGPLDLLIFL